MDAIPFFEQLGLLVDRAWRERHYDDHVFPVIAARCLRDLPPREHVRTTDLIDAVIASPRFPSQVNLEASFGEPPLTVFSSPRFYIEALFWVDGTTAIHQHGFSGAFHVLTGRSIHSQYAFEQKARINTSLLVGELSFGDTELLTAGDTREILSGNKLIHSLFHLDRPSVTIVVRTHSEPSASPQYSYLKPYLALDPFYREPLLQRQIQVLRLLLEIKDPSRASAAAKLIANNDAASAFRIFDAYLAQSPDNTDELHELLRVLKTHHPGPLAEAVSEVMAENLRQRHVIARRRLVADPDHRIFLAALLNLPTRTSILGFIRTCFRREDPVALILRWIKELAALPAERIGNPLGFEVGDAELAIIGYLLEGESDDGAVARVHRDFDEVSAGGEDIRALCAALRGSVLLRPLFQ